ncbi:PDC sensor domain-containing protein [archaeon]|nr:PDC sensor domain-containing protein [archaeon]
MQSRIVLGIAIIFAIGLISATAANAQSTSQIPSWVKTAVTFWANDQISDQEFIEVIQYFVENEIITVPQNHDVVVNLHTLQSELNEKIKDSRVLANNIQVQNHIIESNDLFDTIPNAETVISQLDNRWQDSNPDEPDSIAYNLIHNEVGDIIRQFIQDDIDSKSKFKYAEIIITNTYGGNVAQSGKTTDFRQSDETWWQEAKEHGIYLSEGGFDESAGVYSSDIAIQILDKEGRFIGVLKAVINVDSISSGN